MKPFPIDPMRQHNRFIAALCDDWLEAGTVTRVTPRADRILEISRQVNEGDCAEMRTGAGQPPARAAARLGDPVTIAYRKGSNR